MYIPVSPSVALTKPVSSDAIVSNTLHDVVPTAITLPPAFLVSFIFSTSSCFI